MASDATPASAKLSVCPRDAALRKARTCYVHFAGELGAALTDAMSSRHSDTLATAGLLHTYRHRGEQPSHGQRVLLTTHAVQQIRFTRIPDPFPIAVCCRSIARLPGTRHGVRRAENLPRSGTLAASGGGSDNNEKILSPELAPIGREPSQVCLRQDPLRWKWAALVRAQGLRQRHDEH